jgi:hypothetical protein
VRHLLVALALCSSVALGDQVFNGSATTNTTKSYATPNGRVCQVQAWGDGAANLTFTGYVRADSTSAQVSIGTVASPSVTGKYWSGTCGGQIDIAVTAYVAGTVTWRVVVKQ